MAVEVGHEAPNFTLKNTAGEETRLTDFRGRNVVLLFYPAAFSGACTKQFTHIGESEARYAGENAQVIGISVDGFNAQRVFAQQMGLTDTMLLSDSHPKGAVATAYGTYWEHAGISTRAAFVIDKDGVVRSANILDSPGDLPSEEEYFSTLAACNIQPREGPTMAVCEHEVCTCEAMEGSAYCSAFCAANADAAECHCHHGECTAPHHHH